MTLKVASNLVDSMIQTLLTCTRCTATFTFHIHTGTPAKGTTKSSVLVKTVLCGLQTHKPPFSSLWHRCPSDQRENKPFLEYSLSFCRRAFLPTPELISAQVVFHLKLNLPCGKAYFWTAQLATAANGLLTAARVGLVIPGWEGLLHASLAKLHTALCCN